MESVLLVFISEPSPRISYTFALFFESLILTPYKLTSDVAEYKVYKGPKLNYSKQPVGNDELFICPSGLLSQIGINQQNLRVSEWNGLKIFFEVNEGNLPFDVFSAAFYMVSRYEEYNPTSTDEHSRFKVTDSLAFKNHFLDKPIVNLWAEELKKVILLKYPSVTFSGNKYSFIPTLDIDIAYAHLGRNAAITVGSMLKALFKFDLKNLAEKVLVLLGRRKDPYDTYDYQEALFKKYDLHPIYFFLAGKRGNNDKNISPQSSGFKRLVKRLNTFAEIGIHPSYQSAGNPEIVKEEIGNVESNISKKISSSRQHYLKMKLPETYRCLAELGITDDYTMTFAGAPGFRTGICTPFLFYDLKNESVLPVKVHSSIVMDGTLNDYLHITVPEAIKISNELLKEIKKCGGEFIVIWHNDNLSETRQWKGWRTFFESILQSA